MTATPKRKKPTTTGKPSTSGAMSSTSSKPATSAKKPSTTGKKSTTTSKPSTSSTTGKKSTSDKKPSRTATSGNKSTTSGKKSSATGKPATSAKKPTMPPRLPAKTAKLPRVTLSPQARKRLRLIDYNRQLTPVLRDAIAYIGSHRRTRTRPRRASCPVSMVTANRLVLLRYCMWIDKERTLIMLTFHGERAYAAIKGLPEPT